MQDVTAFGSRPTGKTEDAVDGDSHVGPTWIANAPVAGQNFRTSVSNNVNVRGSVYNGFLLASRFTRAPTRTRGGLTVPIYLFRIHPRLSELSQRQSWDGSIAL